jgi:hypothetical protein
MTLGELNQHEMSPLPRLAHASITAGRPRLGGFHQASSIRAGRYNSPAAIGGVRCRELR